MHVQGSVRLVEALCSGTALVCDGYLVVQSENIFPVLCGLRLVLSKPILLGSVLISSEHVTDFLACEVIHVCYIDACTRDQRSVQAVLRSSSTGKDRHI